MRTTKAMRTRLGAVVIAGAMLLGACAGDDSSSSDGDSGGTTDTTAVDSGTVIKQGWVNEADVAESTGGTLEVTMPSPPLGLDPTVASHGVSSGGAPLMAIYDSLMRWNPDTGEFTPQLADSLESSDDFVTWTLKLRPDVTFSDGTPLDAESVVYSIQRMSNARGSTATYPEYIASYDTPDPQTVVFTLAQPLNNFNALLAGELGYVVSPTAVEADPEGFNTNPVGAGPFTVENFDPAQELVLTKNPNYALGDVPLDGLRFSWNPEQSANLDKLTGGETDLVMLTSIPEEVEAIEGGYPTYTQYVAGSGLAINGAGEGDFPGDDPRVRQAISYALDLDSVNQRVNDGEGIMGNFLYAPGTPLYVDTPFGSYDADKATQLLDEVKAETGWDGSFELLTPAPNDYALAYQALLNAVGFDVTIDQVPTFLELVVRVNLERNYDVSIHAFTTFPTNTYQALDRTFSSDSASNYLGYSNPEMDALLDQLPGADGDEATKEILSQMAELWQTEQPFVLTGNQPFSTITAKDVGGIVPTVNGLIMFDKAYLSS